VQANELLTPGQTAERLLVSKSTLRNWRAQRIRLRYVRAGNRVFYQKEDVEAFMLNFYRIVEVDK
jgi:excisionase family DNA binding protein